MIFDEENHIYIVNGEKKKSVTGFIEQLKSADEIKHFHSKKFQAFMKPYALFGDFIHNETEKMDAGMILESKNYTRDQYAALLSYASKVDMFKEEGKVLGSLMSSRELRPYSIEYLDSIE